MTETEERLFAVRWCLARAAEHAEKNNILASPVEHPLDLVVNGVNITRTILDVLDMIDPARTKAAVSGDWIPVTERLPEWGQTVIVAYDETHGDEGMVGCETHYADGVWTESDRMRGGQPSHWMPLPQHPSCTDGATPSGKTAPD